MLLCVLMCLLILMIVLYSVLGSMMLRLNRCGWFWYVMCSML